MAVAFGVIALVTGDPALLRQLVVGYWEPDLMPFTWWLEVVLVAGGILQGWAYRQVLRGRLTGEPPVGGRRVRLLRAALYLNVASALLVQLPIPYQWRLGVPGDLLSREKATRSLPIASPPGRGHDQEQIRRSGETQVSAGALM